MILAFAMIVRIFSTDIIVFNELMNHVQYSASCIFNIY